MIDPDRICIRAFLLFCVLWGSFIFRDRERIDGGEISGKISIALIFVATCVYGVLLLVY